MGTAGAAVFAFLATEFEAQETELAAPARTVC